MFGDSTGFQEKAKPIRENSALRTTHSDILADTICQVLNM